MADKKAPRNGRLRGLDRPEYEALRKALKVAIEQRSVGQRELARRLGKDHTYVNRILAGRRAIEFGELVDLCAAIGVPLSDVLSATW